jgi:hypothetical protein
MNRVIALAVVSLAMFSAAQAHADPGPSAGTYYTQELLRSEGRLNSAAQLDPPRGDQHEYYAYRLSSAERHFGVDAGR